MARGMGVDFQPRPHWKHLHSSYIRLNVSHLTQYPIQTVITLDNVAPSTTEAHERHIYLKRSLAALASTFSSHYTTHVFISTLNLQYRHLPVSLSQFLGA